MKKVVVLGASGLLGHWLMGAFRLRSDLTAIRVGRSEKNDFVVELTDKEKLFEVFNQISPDVILNLVAEANVDYCEQHPAEAKKANVDIPKIISEYLVANSNCKAIHISTDHVYDGAGFKKENQTTLKNVYAATKFEGEACFKERTFVLRTNFFGKSVSAKDSFSDWVVKSFQSGKSFTLFKDSFFSPVHWSTIFEVIMKCIDSDCYGIYNVGASTCMSKAEFAISLAKELNIYNENFILSTSGVVSGRAQRPSNMCMDSTKLAQAFNIKIAPLENEIRKLKKEYV